MSKSRIILVIAALIALLPFLGFPYAWEAVFQVLAGLTIIGVSEWARIDRKLALKAKARERATRKAVPATPVAPAETPYYGKRVTDFYPKTGQSGRRASDLKPPFAAEEPHEDEAV